MEPLESLFSFVPRAQIECMLWLKSKSVICVCDCGTQVCGEAYEQASSDDDLALLPAH